MILKGLAFVFEPFLESGKNGQNRPKLDFFLNNFISMITTGLAKVHKYSYRVIRVIKYTINRTQHSLQIFV